MVSEVTEDHGEAKILTVWGWPSCILQARKGETHHCVDDCSIVANSSSLITGFKTEIAKHVDITDLGDFHWILGIKVLHIREEHHILLSQQSYIDSILWHYRLEDLKPVSIPMDPNVCLTSAQSPKSTEDFVSSLPVVVTKIRY